MSEASTDSSIFNGVVADIAEINPRTNIVLTEEAQVSFLPMQNTSESGDIIALQSRSLSEVSRGYTRFAENDVLVAKITPCFENGKGGFARGLLNGIGFGSTEFHVVRAIPGKGDSRFLHHLTRSERFRRAGEGSMTGSAGQKRIPAEFIRDFPIFVPPLPEQKKIAEILSGIDNAIQRLQVAVDSHEKARNALMESVFREGYQKAKSGSDEWRTWTIQELLANTPSPMRSGPFGSALLKDELAEEGIPFLGIDNVRTEEFVPSFKRFLTNAKFHELRRYEVFPCDVMITIMGTVGRSCVVPEGMGQCVSSKHTWTMTFDRRKVAPEIICWQLNHFSRTRKRFLESSQGGVMDAISSQTLREIEVPIPTNKEYSKKITEQYLSSRKYQQALQAKLAKIRLLKNAVTSDLLSGRKRVTL